MFGCVIVCKSATNPMGQGELLLPTLAGLLAGGLLAGGLPALDHSGDDSVRDRGLGLLELSSSRMTSIVSGRVPANVDLPVSGVNRIKPTQRRAENRRTNQDHGAESVDCLWLSNATI
ncbi:hypothetical protein ON010_g7428 [Phytophthora cinnamomi]|nr:hypothetical protein ON010_g7428 [Phytophthora cinnamomi]